MKRPSPMLPYILKKVLPVTLLAMALLWLAIRVVAADALRREVHQRVAAVATEEGKVIAGRLKHLMDSVRHLARNDLLINGLMDHDARKAYLPTFFQSLRIPGPAGVWMTLTDYRGRVMASNRSDGKDYGGAPWIGKVMEGKDHFSISSEGLEVAAPVLYSGLPEGMVVAAYSPAQVEEIFFISLSGVSFAVFDRRGDRLFSSPDAPWETLHSDAQTSPTGWIEVRQGVPGFEDLTLICGEPVKEAFRALSRLDAFFAGILALSLLAVAAAVFVTARMVAQPLSALARRMDAVTDLTNLREPLSETGPSELRDLARSFNRLMTSLAATTWNMQKRMKELDCLYGVAMVFETSDSLDEILQGTLNVVPQGMVYPEITCCRIVLEGEVYDSTPPCGLECETCRMACLSQHLGVYGKIAGQIRICYLEDRPQRDEGPFIHEERRLIDMIAERLGHAVERLRARHALQESEERLKLALQGADLAAWDWHLPSGRVMYSMPLAGKAGDEPEVIATSYGQWEERIHPEDRPVLLTALNAHLYGEAGTYEAEYRVRIASGKWAWILDKGTVLERDSDGSPIRAYGTHLDITRRKQAEEEARQASEKAAIAAGRAQMSAMVLHHIGNAVTPLGIYVEAMKEKTAHGLIEYLEKSYQDLRGHMDDLQTYLSENGRGRQVFEYMNALIQSLKEQQEQRQETIRKIDHGLSDILEILARQQQDEEERKMGDGQRVRTTDGHR